MSGKERMLSFSRTQYLKLHRINYPLDMNLFSDIADKVLMADYDLQHANSQNSGIVSLRLVAWHKMRM